MYYLEEYQFTAKEYDEETGLYYMSARYMNPKTSRWVSSDPKGWELINPNKKQYNIIEAQNPYSYVGNNPVKYNDLTGNNLVNGIRALTINTAQSIGNVAVSAWDTIGDNAAQITNVANKVGSITSAVGTAAAGVAIVAAATGVGAPVATVAYGCSAVASGVSLVANVAAENYVDAAVDGGMIVASAVGGKLVGAAGKKIAGVAVNSAGRNISKATGRYVSNLYVNSISQFSGGVADSLFSGGEYIASELSSSNTSAIQNDQMDVDSGPTYMEEE